MCLPATHFVCQAFEVCLCTCEAWMTAGSAAMAAALAYNGFSKVTGCLATSMAK